MKETGTIKATPSTGNDILREVGHEVIVAYDAAEALSHAEREHRIRSEDLGWPEFCQLSVVPGNEVSFVSRSTTI